MISSKTLQRDPKQPHSQVEHHRRQTSANAQRAAQGPTGQPHTPDTLQRFPCISPTLRPANERRSATSQETTLTPSTCAPLRARIPQHAPPVGITAKRTPPGASTTQCSCTTAPRGGRQTRRGRWGWTSTEPRQPWTAERCTKRTPDNSRTMGAKLVARATGGAG